jgi:ABC-type antimicrobial peptide transport system permease subunit
MVLAKTMAMVAAGLGVGFAGSIAAASLLQGMLYGVGARDPRLLIIAGSVITITGLVAAYVPAHRAAAIDPMRALRSE